MAFRSTRMRIVNTSGGTERTKSGGGQGRTGPPDFFGFILRLCFFVSLPGQVPAVLPARRQGAELRKVAGRFALAFLEGLVACPAFF